MSYLSISIWCEYPQVSMNDCNAEDHTKCHFISSSSASTGSIKSSDTKTE